MNKRWWDDKLPAARATIDRREPKDIITRSREAYRRQKVGLPTTLSTQQPPPEPPVEFDGQDLVQNRPFDYWYVDWRVTRAYDRSHRPQIEGVPSVLLIETQGIRQHPSLEPKDTELFSTLDTKKEVLDYDQG